MGVYSCAERFAWRIIDEKVVILDTGSGDYYTLNETASAAWESLMGGCTAEETAQRLMTVFDVDAARAASDVSDLVASFERDGFLAPRGSSVGSGENVQP